MPEKPKPPPKLLFLQMPWASAARPSIAIGILEQLCDEAGTAHESFYFNLEVAASLGTRVAELFADNRGLFGLSEHLFAADLFGAERIRSDDFLEMFAASTDAPSPVSDLGWLRSVRDDMLPALLDGMAQRVLAAEPTVVGFTATFNQVLAGLALSARLKRARPELTLVFGGACYDDEMGIEYHRSLPHLIDHVFMAEAESAFREFLRRLGTGEHTREIPGVTWWDGQEVQLIPGGPLADMNSSPMPSYDAYFSERARIESAHDCRVPLDKIPFETSRGCWWGQKNHCVFCGLNHEFMEFRSKNIDRIIEEITALSSRYQVTRLMATDWIISRTQRGDIFRRLKDLGLDLEIFFETRADLTKDEIRLMKEAGVNRVQPGIESFSTPLLRLMRKHTRGIRQIQFLRWCRELDVHPSYHLLAGFPGEQSEWYSDVCALIPRLRHLDPPRHNVFPVELHRFSPLFKSREEFGITEYDIRADYLFNFPSGLVNLKKVGYYFEFTSSLLGDVDQSVAPLRAEVEKWMLSHRNGSPPVCTYRVGPDFLSITDTRRGARREATIDGLARDVLLLCDEVKTMSELAADCASKHAAAASDGTLQRVLRTLVEEDLLLEEDGLFLTLPISHRPRTTGELRGMALGKVLIGD